MKNINLVCISGRLTRDPEIKYTSSGMAIANFSLASTARVKKNGEWTDDPNFFDCRVFGKSAETFQQYAKKGRAVIISGALKNDRWEKDGQKHSIVYVLVNDFELGATPNGNNNGNTGASYSEPEPEPNQEFNEDIPF